MGLLYRKLILPLLLWLQGIPLYSVLRECKRLNLLDENSLEAFQLKQLKLLAEELPYLSADSRGKVQAAKRMAEALDGIPLISKKELRSFKIKPGFGSVMRETAGTTGAPTKFWLTKKTVACQLAVRAYSLNMLNIEYGEREARLWGRRDFSLKSRIKNALLNRMVFNFLDGDMEKLAKKLVSYEPAYIYGYSSIVLKAAQYFQASHIKAPPLKAVICTAENLQKFQQDFIQKVFNCPVVMEYGCTEVDIIAFQCVDRHYHLVNPWLVVEADKNKTIVTDLSQSIMPVMRYEVGDDVEFGELSGNCEHGPRRLIIKSIVGRSLNQTVFLPNNKTKHAVIFAYIAEDLFEDLPAFSRFLVIQKTLTDFLFYVEMEKEPDPDVREAISNMISEYYINHTGVPGRFDVRYVSRIPQFPGSKFNYFVSDLSEGVVRTEF